MVKVCHTVPAAQAQCIAAVARMGAAAPLADGHNPDSRAAAVWLARQGTRGQHRRLRLTRLYCVDLARWDAGTGWAGRGACGQPYICACRHPAGQTDDLPNLQKRVWLKAADAQLQGGLHLGCCGHGYGVRARGANEDTVRPEQGLVRQGLH